MRHTEPDQPGLSDLCCAAKKTAAAENEDLRRQIED